MENSELSREAIVKDLNELIGLLSCLSDQTPTTQNAIICATQKAKKVTQLVESRTNLDQAEFVVFSRRLEAIHSEIESISSIFDDVVKIHSQIYGSTHANILGATNQMDVHMIAILKKSQTVGDFIEFQENSSLDGREAAVLNGLKQKLRKLANDFERVRVNSVSNHIKYMRNKFYEGTQKKASDEILKNMFSKPLPGQFWKTCVIQQHDFMVCLNRGLNAIRKYFLKRGSISIWWDIENCAIPRDSVDVKDVYNNLKNTLRNMDFHGDLEVFGYCKPGFLTSAVMLILKRSGINITVVPASDKKDTSDKRMLVDMPMWSTEKYPPATVMLISGDVDFAYCLQKLASKGYNIMVAHPDESATAHKLLLVANRTMLWSSLASGNLIEQPAVEEDVQPMEDGGGQPDGGVQPDARRPDRAIYIPPWKRN